MKEAWQKLIHWEGWRACANGWKAFLHWKGWSDLVHWEGWRAFARWKGWNPHPVLTLLLTAAAAAGLVWVFANGLEESFVAYPIYCIAAYALTVLCVGIPKTVKWVRERVLEHKLVKPLLEDKSRLFLLDLFREEIVNLGYGIFKTVSGLMIGVAWVWADGLYNLVQGVIQLGQLTLHRKHLPIEAQWKSYRVCGWMILVVHLTMTGLVFMMIHRGEAEEYPGYMIFATAAFTFYKLITSFVEVARDRKHVSPVDSSVYLLDLTQALFSLFSLQVALLHAFNDGSIDPKLMNSLTGGVVCLLVMATGIYMIRRANRELIRLLNRNQYGNHERGE